MQHYFLAKHAFACAIGADVIVLDLKRDKYLAFERDFWEPIVRRIGGWPLQDATVRNAAAAPNAAALSALMANGLLTEDSDAGKDATPASIVTASVSLIEDFRVQPPRIRMSHVFVFVGAIVAASIRLRLQPIEKIVQRVRAKTEEGLGSRALLSPIDLATLRDLTEVFRRLRPLLFSSRDHCLFESLALLNFLSHYRIHPSWVFGVATAPFAAHCWLQLGGFACNDSLDQVRRFTPIMVI